ncbi:DUF4148 domain-containing protein, partial [Achromobacter spanius]|uniref:DUF4148 domain-containing protein n=1 Tax=Achromobacter spanius TaxID=217203 RepID=UPI003F68D9A2
MKTLTTTLLLSLALVGVGAQAAGVEQAKTRDQVATELQQAKANGQYTFGELDYPPPQAPPPPMSAPQKQPPFQKTKINREKTLRAKQ